MLKHFHLQLFSTRPQQFAYQTDAQEDQSAFYRQQQEYQVQQQQIQQQQQQLQQQELQRKQIEQNNNLYTTYQVPQAQQAQHQQAQEAQQIQSQSQPDLSAYYQQVGYAFFTFYLNESQEIIIYTHGKRIYRVIKFKV